MGRQLPRPGGKTENEWKLRPFFEYLDAEATLAHFSAERASG